MIRPLPASPSSPHSAPGFTLSGEASGAAARPRHHPHGEAGRAGAGPDRLVEGGVGAAERAGAAGGLGDAAPAAAAVAAGAVCPDGGFALAPAPRFRRACHAAAYRPGSGGRRRAGPTAARPAGSRRGRRRHAGRRRAGVAAHRRGPAEARRRCARRPACPRLRGPCRPTCNSRPSSRVRRSRRAHPAAQPERRTLFAPVMPAYAPTPVVVHAPTVQTASALSSPAPFVGSALGMGRTPLAAPVPVTSAAMLGYASGQ